ncbi:copper homeostasis periplasmic binding protein CopC [Rhizobium sp. NPDC090275]|uniref:copper homeostasis periplasmic binding protein CopC n=1 Tax=Rhizobium sp. NPDC090275 TaxID=3364498 RepID=UPI003839D711
MISKLAAPLAVLFSGLIFAGPVRAHAHLKFASPPEGATVNSSTPTSPVTLTFTEGLEPAYSTIAVTDETGQPVPTESAIIGPEDATTLSAVPTRPLSPGVYNVNWHVLSKDGHSTSGSYRFTVTP